MIFNVTSGGGAGLSLRVLGGTTQPTSPREGTIWVNTSAEKPDYIISESQPGSPASGLVWIKLGSEGVNVPVDKKGTLAITLAGCAVWSGSTWDNVDAWVYTGGKWVQFGYAILYLYKQGNQYTDITGGIIDWAWKTDAPKKGTLTFLPDAIRLVASGSTVAATPARQIDLSKYTRLIVRKTSAYIDNTNRAFIGITKTKGLQETGDFTARAALDNVDSGTYSIDISTLSGLYWVGVFLFAVTGITYTLDFDELRLE